MAVVESPVALAASATRAQPGRGWFWIGPAFVTSMAYIDPGNFGTNFVAGNSTGYQLVWVVIVANLIAMFVQSLTAKLGLATGQSLAANCRRSYRRPTVLALWVQAELMAVATDVAEIVGGAIALHLLFGLPIGVGGLVTAAAAVAILAMQTRGRRPFEPPSSGPHHVPKHGPSRSRGEGGRHGGPVAERTGIMVALRHGASSALS